MGANAAGWYQDTPCLFSTLSLCFGRHYQWKYFLADTGNPLYVTIVWHTPFISMLNIQTLRSSTCADFHVFLLFSVSLFFSLLTSSFLSLLRSDPYTKTLQVFDLTPYLVQSPRCIWIDGLLTSVRELSLFRACWKDPVTRLGYRAIQHVFDKEDVRTFEVYSTLHGNSPFTSKPQFPGPLQSCGAVTSLGFVFSTSTSIIHTGVKHYL